MIDTASLVDQYCHGVLRTELGLGTFEDRLRREALGATAQPGTTGPPAVGTSFFDTQTGFAVRRWCPPLLGLEPHCPPARYLARRRELGASAAAGLLLRSTGISTYLVDTAGAAAPLGTDPAAPDRAGPGEMAAMAGADAREIVRLEPLAVRAADTAVCVGGFLAGCAAAVHTAGTSAAGFSAGAGAVRSAALDPEPPGPGEVRGAAGRWLAGRRAGDPLTDPVLLRHLLWTAVTARLPLQLHTGALGGPAPGEGGGPLALTGFATATAGLGVALVLLGTPPYHRHAARMTALFPHVYADLGPGLARTGARAAAVLAEVLELAPFGKLLFSSGARGLPELHVVAARVFREAVARVLGGWVAEGAWSARDARRVAGMIAADNARRLYGLPGG